MSASTPHAFAPAPHAFAPWTQAWLQRNFDKPTPVQTRGWAAIATGAHVLLTAPTGSGKTLAGFLSSIDRLCRPDASETMRPPGVRVLYISPLKALVHDIDRNLTRPLAGIAVEATRLGATACMPRVAVRTGDTSASDRRRQAREPAEILVTTPESLYLLLGSRARETLATVETVIIDEAHALADNKRGAHLALSLERLSALTRRDPQRVGLSATARPLHEVARYVGGDRAVEIVDASEPPHLDVRIEVPASDMTQPVPPAPQAAAGAREHDPQPERGMWAVIVPRLVELIRAHKSTIVFVNSRGLCERLCHRINDAAGQAGWVRAHHGSIAHGERRIIEEQLKRGELAGIVATSSLELGIDMGAVDLVLLVESPGTVARGLQRVGRAGHRVGEQSVARMLPKHRGDLLEATVIAERMRKGEIEALHMPEHALDVLAQQIVAMTAVEPIRVPVLAARVRRTAPYRNLPDAALHAVLDMLSGRFPSTDFAELRPRVVWDRARDELSTRRGSAMVALVNGGTIPDRGAFSVHLGEHGPRVGELDEEMVYESHPGDVFTLGASSFRVEQITRDRVVVSHAPGELGRLPFWRGDGPGRPLELGRAIGAFTRTLAQLPHADAHALLQTRCQLDEDAATNLLAYVAEQREATGTLPTDDAITIERSRDELGDHRICILSPLGNRVHAPWALALAAKLERQRGVPIETMHSDEGIVLRISGQAEPLELSSLLPSADEVDALVRERLPATALFAGAFRENATRALLLPRRKPGSRMPLWLQRKRSAELLSSALRFADFPIVVETYRTCMRDLFDLPALRELLTAIESRAVRVDDVTVQAPSPFARNLLLDYAAAYAYAGDAPLAEQNARMLALDTALLRSLLGDAALQTLLDHEAVSAVEDELQRLAPERRARDADSLHDVLRALGDLDEDELQARCTEPIAAPLEALRDSGRALRVTLAGGPRVIATEDSALYAAALGALAAQNRTSEPTSAPPDALLQIVQRYARTHGPFTASTLGQRYGVPTAQARAWLQPLLASGVLVQGALRPQSAALSETTEIELCDRDVLDRMRRRSRALLSARLSPVPAKTLARFLPAWMGLDAPREGLAALEEAIAQLQGLPLPLVDLERFILPARVRGYAPALLDQLGATGAVCWVGHGRLGASDGRVALYLRSQVGRLLDPDALPAQLPDAPSDQLRLYERILEHLAQRGASFFAELVSASAPSGHVDVVRALHELLWTGHVTSDAFSPLRASAPKRSNTHAAAAGGIRSRAGTLALARLSAGRFALTRSLLDSSASLTLRAHARAQLWLERYGIVTREVAVLEEPRGGFVAMMPVLSAMEEAGKAQRGYFIEDLGGMQLAQRGAVERLRSHASRPAGVRVLAATDPANPFGWALQLPGAVDPQTSPDTPADPARFKRVPARSAHALLVLADTEPVVMLSAQGKHLTSFPAAREPAQLEGAIDALQQLGAPPGKRKPLRLNSIDGVAARDASLAPALIALGFAPAYRGLERD